MNRHNKPCISNQPPVYHWWKPDERVSLELDDFVLKEKASNIYAKPSRNYSKLNESKSSQVLSTSQIISVFGQAWGLASRPFTFFELKRSSNQEIDDAKVTFDNLVEVNGKAVNATENKKNCNGMRTDGHCSSKLWPTLDLLTVTQKISMLEPGKDYSMSSFWRLLQSDNEISDESWKRKGLASVQISYDLGKIYGWVTDVIHREVWYPLNVADTEIMKAGAFKAREDLSDARGCISVDANFLANELIDGTSKASHYSIQSVILPSLAIPKLDMRATENAHMVSRIRMFIEADGSILRSPNPDVLAVQRVPHKDDTLDYRQKTDSCEKHEGEIKEPDKLIIENGYKIEGFSSTREKPRYTFAKQEHAVAGALAGVFVSLCLHPVDTFKTVVQSYRAEQRSLSYIGKSIVSERGFFGLYRGISTNIASSAPISAVYTFTYESVKAALLPFFPKEYHSFAHCVAGGCASIATSFIFTPSERIKQQMQVSSRYHNCWNAFVGIVAKDGLRGLYAGWGAVLCRNIPHSIIKFYTYESLKGLMKSNAQPSTLETLVCGGVAGSTAALFTTPFDVVKTRLQTQIPGSLSPYKSVFHALHEIAKKEGLKGLYRGLTPRLIMYISQGAIFFASYEFFKRHFSLENVQCQPDGKEDSATKLQFSASSSSSSTTKVQNLPS